MIMIIKIKKEAEDQIPSSSLSKNSVETTEQFYCPPNVSDTHEIRTSHPLTILTI